MHQQCAAPAECCIWIGRRQPLDRSGTIKQPLTVDGGGKAEWEEEVERVGEGEGRGGEGVRGVEEREEVRHSRVEEAARREIIQGVRCTGKVNMDGCKHGGKHARRQHTAESGMYLEGKHGG